MKPSSDSVYVRSIPNSKISAYVFALREVIKSGQDLDHENMSEVLRSLILIHMSHLPGLSSARSLNIEEYPSQLVSL